MILKIKNQPIYALVGLIFSFAFLFFAYTHPLDTPYQKSNVILPQISMPAGTFALTTEPDEGITPVLNMIKNSTHSIDLVIYELDDQQISDALIAAKNKGITVRVLLNGGYFDKKEKTNASAFDYLKSNGVDVRDTPSKFALTHQKTLITEQNQALIMTLNLVSKYYPTGRDFGILDKDQKDVQAIEDTFDADWNNKKLVEENGDDLVWSPGSDAELLLLINSAKKELDIYNEEMADARIITALEDAVHRGVNVNIVMTYDSNWKAAFTELKNAGAHLHLFHGEKGLYIHAKMIMADQVYAFLGSENFSYGSMNQNRELGIFLSDPAVISSLFKTFSIDWQKAKVF